MDWVLANWDDIMLIITGIITVASIIARLTPTPKDDDFISNIIRVLSLNKRSEDKSDIKPS